MFSSNDAFPDAILKPSKILVLLRFAVTNTWYAFSVFPVISLPENTSSLLKSPESIEGVLTSCRPVPTSYPPFIIRSVFKWKALFLRSVVVLSGASVGV